MLAPKVLLWDEAAFLANARGLTQEVAYDETFRNPFLSWVIASAWMITGENIFVARSISLLSGAAVILLSYFIARRHASEDHSLLFALLVATNQHMLLWSGVAYAEALTLALVLGSLLAFEMKKYLVAGVLAGASFLTRFANAIVVAILSLNRKLYFFIGLAVLLIPWLIINYLLHGNPLWDLQTQGQVIATYTASEPILPFLFTLTLIYLPFLVFLRKGNKNYYAMLILFFLLHLFVIRLKLPRYGLALLPFLIMLAAPNIREYSKKILVGLIAYSIIIMILLWPSTGLCPSIIHESMDAVEERHQPGEEVMSNVWPYTGYYLNVTSRSLHSDDWRDLERITGPHHLLFIRDHGLHYEESVLRQFEEEGRLSEREEITTQCGSAVLWRVQREFSVQ